MEKQRYSGRRLVFWGALLLMVWAGYECYVRMDMLVWWFNGVMRISAGEGIPFFRLAAQFDASMFVLTSYLSLLVLFSVAAIILRNRPMGDYVILGLCVAAAVAGGTWANLFSLSIFDWAQTLKLVPLLMIFSGCLINISQFYLRKSRGGNRREGPMEEVDYTRMDTRELARQVKRHKTKKDAA